jgi:hypothetical protein
MWRDFCTHIVFGGNDWMSGGGAPQFGHRSATRKHHGPFCRGHEACLGAAVRAPVTSILIVFEMTHDFAVFPVLRADGTLEGVVSRLALQHFVE